MTIGKIMKKFKALKEQILKFGIVGVIAFIIDYAILYILTEIFGVFYLISALISFCVSTIINYRLSTRWVFSVKQELSRQKQFIIFVILSLIGLLINELIMYISVERFEIHYMIGKLISTVIVMFWNFITKKLTLEGHP